MAFVVFIPALLNEEATDAPAHGDDLARRHTADLRSVGASWLRCMLGLAADAAAHMLRRVWCHAEKICFDGSSCRSKVRGTGVNRVVRGGRQRHGLPMEHWWRRDRAASGPTFAAGQRACAGSCLGKTARFEASDHLNGFTPAKTRTCFCALWGTFCLFFNPTGDRAGPTRHASGRGPCP